MSKVFISYRREDAAGYAQAIYTQLERQLPRDHIFMDVDTIDGGVDFVTRIEQAISESHVVIALIGKRWMGRRDNTPPRIYDPQDFVRLEIEAALSRDIRVIPVLVDGANMPSIDELPPSLQPILRRHALELSNTRFRFDLERVSQTVQKALGSPNEHRRIKWHWRPWMWYGGLSFMFITLGIAATLWIKGTEEKQIIAETLDKPGSVETLPTIPKDQVKALEPKRENGSSPNWELLATVPAEPENGKPVSGTWSVYLDPASVKRNGKFVEANVWLKMNRPMCHPSAYDCRDRIAHSYDSYRFYCDGTGRAQITSSTWVLDLTQSESKYQPPPRTGLSEVRTVGTGTLASIAEYNVCKSTPTPPKSNAGVGPGSIKSE
jgi:hypothetical protein